MTAPEDLEAMRQEFERLALLDPSGAAVTASQYGLRLVQSQTEMQKQLEEKQRQLTEVQRQLAELKAGTKDLLIRFLAIGGGYWENLPQLPAVKAEP